MTQGFETINGHRYFVIRDDAGNILTQAGADAPVQQPSAKPLMTKALALAQAPVPLTQNQRDRISQLTLALLLGLTDD